MEKKEQLYEGKAKKVFKTDDPEVLMVDYKDDATAFNGEKKGTIQSKGIINNRVTNHLMKMLEEQGIPTHLIKEISDRETLVKKVTIVPLEVIIRNVAAGSFSKRYGVEEGKELLAPTLEFSLKNDDLGDPLINSYHVLALGLATQEEIDTIAKYAFKVNEILRKYLLWESNLSTLSLSLVKQVTALLFLPMRFLRIPAVSGIRTQMKNSTKTDLDVIWAVLRTLMKKL